MKAAVALLSLSLAACATARQSKEPAAQIPANWIDLPWKFNRKPQISITGPHAIAAAQAV